jgi:hypothetical protein
VVSIGSEFSQAVPSCWHVKPGHAAQSSSSPSHSSRQYPCSQTIPGGHTEGSSTQKIAQVSRHCRLRQHDCPSSQAGTSEHGWPMVLVGPVVPSEGPVDPAVVDGVEVSVSPLAVTPLAVAPVAVPLVVAVPPMLALPVACGSQYGFSPIKQPPSPTTRASPTARCRAAATTSPRTTVPSQHGAILAHGSAVPDARAIPSGIVAIARHRRSHPLLGVLVSITFASPALAAAPQRSVVVLPTTSEGETTPVALERIDESLRRGLAAGGVATVDGEGPPCSDAECLNARAKTAGTDTAVQLRLVLEGRDYRMELLATDREGKLLSTTAECAICGFDEAATAVADEASRLAGKLSEGPKPARLTVGTTPVGAVVYLDGTPVGTSPLAFDVPPGEHELRMEKDGHNDKQAAYVAVSGVQETLSFELVAHVAPTPPNPKMRIGGWAAVGAGLVPLAGGVGLLAIDDRPAPGRCDEPANIDGRGVCRYQLTTMPVGAVLLAVGSASLAAGVVWLVVDRQRRKAGRAQARVVPSGLGLAGRF